MSQFDILKTYTKKYYLTHPWEILFEIKRNLVWAWQRVFRGWDDRVVWSIDFYLFEMMPQWLRQLKEVKHGTPIWCFEAIGAEFDDEVTHSYSDKAHDKASAHFDYVIDKMIEGFEAGYKAANSDLDVYDDFVQWQIDTYGQEIEDQWTSKPHGEYYAMERTPEYDQAYNGFGVHEKVEAEYRALNHKLNIALQLFSKYHDSLWD